MRHLRRRLRSAIAIAGLAALGLPGAAHAQAPGAPTALSWRDCGDGFQCASAAMPLDYSSPAQGTYHVALIRKPATDQAHRLGTLFTNPGGPGASGVDFVRDTADTLYADLNKFYDIVGFDPRGTGASDDPINCKINPETGGLYAQPFTTPFNADPVRLFQAGGNYAQRCKQLNGAVLPYVTTANVARDLDRLRAATGDSKLNYLGFSYGTFLGATYASLFPERLGRVVLDGPVDADAYINKPMSDLRAQTAAFEQALGRFFDACAGDQKACLGFGGAAPRAAYDMLAAKLDHQSLPADGDTADPRPVDGDDLRAATIQMLYAKQFWPYIAQMLASAQNGDGSVIRYFTDVFYGRNDDGSYDPMGDRYFAITAVEQHYVQNPALYLQAGAASFTQNPHFWFNNGYSEIPYPLLGVQPNGAYDGPFRIPASANTPLVVATTYDPATPYRGALALVRDLGNARLLTMNGDGHTAYGRNSDCIDGAVDAYLEKGEMPSAAVCTQDVPFAQKKPAPASSHQTAAAARALHELTGARLVKPVPLLVAVAVGGRHARGR